MKIAILNDSKQSLGGGWTFIDNLKTGVERVKIPIEFGDVATCDLAFIPSSSMVTRETIELVRGFSKKIVLRIDNIPRNSRNRNTGTSRLKAYAELASGLIYQSKWAEGYIGPWLRLNTYSQVIYNGVDKLIFNTEGDRYNFDEDGHSIYLYSRYNRDETKCWEKAWYRFQMIHREKKARLVLVGQFSPEQVQYGFDFFNGEDVTYMGVVSDKREMAKIYRSCSYFLATYFNDAYSNTYQESLACGLVLDQPDLTGGTEELLHNGPIDVVAMAMNYYSFFKEVIERGK